MESNIREKEEKKLGGKSGERKEGKERKGGGEV